jgi:hypothetical protein
MIVKRNVIIFVTFSQAVLLAAAVRVYVTWSDIRSFCFHDSAVTFGFHETESDGPQRSGRIGKGK